MKDSKRQKDLVSDPWVNLSFQLFSKEEILKLELQTQNSTVLMVMGAGAKSGPRAYLVPNKNPVTEERADCSRKPRPVTSPRAHTRAPGLICSTVPGLATAPDDLPALTSSIASPAQESSQSPASVPGGSGEQPSSQLWPRLGSVSSLLAVGTVPRKCLSPGHLPRHIATSWATKPSGLT